jgi:hypothetical protein
MMMGRVVMMKEGSGRLNSMIERHAPSVVGTNGFGESGTVRLRWQNGRR